MNMQESVEGRVAHRTPQMHRVAVGVIATVAALMILTDVIQAIALSTGRVLVSAGGANPRLSVDALQQLIAPGGRPGAVDAVAGATVVDRLLFMAPSLTHATMVAVATILLLQVLRGIAAGEPFSAPVLRRWRELAVALLLGGAAQILIDLLTGTRLSALINHNFGTDRTPVEDQFLVFGGDFAPVGENVPTVVAGLVALALTAAFRAGARLVEDADGLV